MIPCGGELAQYLGNLKEVGVDCLLDGSHPGLLAEVVRPQQAEVIVRVAVVQRQNQIYQGLPAAQAPPAQAPQALANKQSSRVRMSVRIR